MIAASCFESGVTGDVSQLGDWSSFRNVVIDGKPGIITTEMYNPMAKKGTLHFDFSGAGSDASIRPAFHVSSHCQHVYNTECSHLILLVVCIV